MASEQATRAALKIIGPRPVGKGINAIKGWSVHVDSAKEIIDAELAQVRQENQRLQKLVDQYESDAKLINEGIARVESKMLQVNTEMLAILAKAGRLDDTTRAALKAAVEGRK